MTTTRLSIHFTDTVEMMEWFHSIRDAGGFGSVKHPEAEHADLPRLDVGVREIDSLDNGKIKPGNSYIVAGTKDPGYFVELVEGAMLPPHTITKGR